MGLACPQLAKGLKLEISNDNIPLNAIFKPSFVVGYDAKDSEKYGTSKSFFLPEPGKSIKEELFPLTYMTFNYGVNGAPQMPGYPRVNLSEKVAKIIVNLHAANEWAYPQADIITQDDMGKTI